MHASDAIELTLMSGWLLNFVLGFGFSLGGDSKSDADKSEALRFHFVATWGLSRN